MDTLKRNYNDLLRREQDLKERIEHLSGQVHQKFDELLKGQINKELTEIRSEYEQVCDQLKEIQDSINDGPPPVDGHFAIN